MTRAAAGRPVRLGLRANLAQFSLLVGVNALVGGMIGQERTVLPLLAEQVFHLRAFTAALTFILAFGAVKAATNFFAGTLSDRIGRKPVLVAGWLVGLPVPLLLLWAPNWGWIILANVLLGINQGLTWSTTVIMKIDLVGPQRRGLAMGLNEAAGHVSTSAAAHQGLSTRQVFLLTSFKEKALSAASQAGMVNNLNDGLAWGIFPLFFASYGLSVSRIGILAALYPAVWGAGQLLTGALSDRVGRKWLIAGGMWIQAVAIGLIAAVHSFGPWAAGALLLGAGTAMVYPTLLAGVVGRRLPAVARRRLRHRRAARRRDRRPTGPGRRYLDGRRPHRRLRRGRRRAHVRDPPPHPAIPGFSSAGRTDTRPMRRP